VDGQRMTSSGAKTLVCLVNHLSTRDALKRYIKQEEEHGRVAASAMWYGA